eukprot:gnl/MRDRNA2_/MRDRNA2_120943_c0_seq1.p1 gnl/MRDRNA2_/MRDRNA2_120943_c0~~gnl/MRDRNA2_/MRDRNA2_120943_c0_seq1.p1  ORF type:complete len:396 (-),score=97.75 gnl/MRDRNA2_/MRDRNA2_120943_c0_seq1:43-1230(-)
MAGGPKGKGRKSSSDTIGLQLIVLDISALASSRGTTAGAYEATQIAELFGPPERIGELTVCLEAIKKRCSICLCGNAETKPLKDGLKLVDLLSCFDEIRGDVAAPGEVVKALLSKKQLAPGNAMLISQSLGHLLPARMGRWCQTFLLAPPRAGLAVQDMERLLHSCREATDPSDTCLPQFRGDCCRELSHHEVSRLQDARSALLDYLKMPTVGGIQGALVALNVPPPCGWVQERLEGACIVSVRETLTVLFTDELSEVMFEELLSAEMQPPAVSGNAIASQKRLTALPDVHAAAGIASLLDEPAGNSPSGDGDIQCPLVEILESDDFTRSEKAVMQQILDDDDHLNEAQKRAEMEDAALQIALQESQRETAASIAVEEDEEAIMAKILELSKVDQ